MVKIYGDTSGNPGTLLATMTNPGTITEEAVNVFTAPANTMLSASTPYWVVTSNSADTSGQGFRVRVISNTNLDRGTAAGWSIGNARWKSNIANTSWSTSSSRIRFEIRGTGGTTTNNPPTVANAIPDQTATAGTAFSYAFPATTFSDTDTGDTLTYAATKADDTALPTWLAFAAGTRTFSGTPQAADTGTVSVKVTASDGNGGSVSDEFDITVSAIVPGAPSALSATAIGSTQINLSWTAPASTGGSAITGYKIEVSPDGTSSWTDLVADTTSTTTTYSHTGLAAGSTRHYRVSAINANGTGTPSNTATTATEVPADWSLKPTALTVGDKFRLLFLSSTKRDDSSTDIADYNTFVQGRAAAGHADIRTYSAGFRAVGCTSAVDARDNTGTTYTTTDKGIPIYWLDGAKAVDDYEDFYDGSWDDEANDKNESGTNGPDTSLGENRPITGCRHDGTEAFNFGNFSRALGATSVRLGQPNRSDSGDGPLSNTDSANSLNSIPRPMYGLSAVFQVAAAVVTTVPGAPTGLTAMASGTTAIDLSWSAPAITGGSAITGYKIEVSPNGTSGWTDQVANTNSTATTYAHTGLSAGTTGHYRVSAINANGTGTASNVANATTGQTTVTFGASSYTATEGGAAATVTVALSAAPSASVTIPLTTAHLNGATAADHAGIPATVTFGTNQTVMAFTVTATDDADTDGGESVQLGFGTLPAGYAPGARRTATVTLVDDDANLIVNFGTERHTTVKVLESDTVWHRFIFSLSTSRYGPPNGNPQQPVTIPLVVTHVGGAKAEEDYEGIPKSVTFEVGQSVTDFSMRAIPDGKREPGEGLRLDFGPLPPGVRKGTWGPYETIAFVDQVLPGYTVLFGAEAYTATEGGAPARVSIHLSEPVEIEPLVVGLVVTHVGATAADYTGIPKSVRFGVGEQTQTITVTATDDTDDDDGESVTLSFVNDPNGRVRVRTGPASATVALADNDGTRRVTVSFGFGTLPEGVFAGSPAATTVTLADGGEQRLVVNFGSSRGHTVQVREGARRLRLNVLLDSSPRRPVTIPLVVTHVGGATEADYAAIPESVTFAAGQTSAHYYVRALPDEEDETGEGLQLDFGPLPPGVRKGTWGPYETIDFLDPAPAALLPAFAAFRLLTSGNASAQDSVESDRAVLVALYNATDGPNWTGNTHWLSNEPLSEWRGVGVNDDGRVTALWLFGNQLTGEIPVELSQLSQLQDLSLDSNQLTGEIPVELSQLSQLQLLYLSSNRLTGEIPAELGDLAQLNGLYLHGNELNGPIPSWLVNLTELRELSLWSNQLTGTIPPEVAPAQDRAALVVLYLQTDGPNWTDNTNWARSREPLSEWHGVSTDEQGRVEELRLSANGLNGTIGAELGVLTRLTGLYLNDNELTGTIPPELENLTQLQVFDIRNTGLCVTADSELHTWIATIQDFQGPATCGASNLLANFMNGNSDAFSSRAYLFNPSDSDGTVTVRVFTLPFSDGIAQELTGTPLDLGTLGARSALNIKLAEDILTPLGITTPYTTDGGNLTLEFTIQAADARGVAQVFSSDFAFGTYPMQEIPSTSSESPTVLVANFMNGNDAALNSRVYLWNPSLSAGSVTVRVFTLPLTAGVAQELTTAPLDLGTLGAESARNLKLVEDILTPLGIPTPYVTDGGNLTLEFTIQAADVRGAAQVFSSSFAFGTVPLQVIQ